MSGMGCIGEAMVTTATTIIEVKSFEAYHRHIDHQPPDHIPPLAHTTPTLMFLLALITPLLVSLRHYIASPILVNNKGVVGEEVPLTKIHLSTTTIYTPTLMCIGVPLPL
eukprot:GFYU01023257.1.p3 GENE.GFYU01023257.1~~GFYU01023257.1.p3  ORF type:complete len:110 (-),score=8.56 GFYU01023257.1:108-437(-)